MRSTSGITIGLIALGCIASAAFSPVADSLASEPEAVGSSVAQSPSLKKLDLSYFLRLNGPQWGKSPSESFNFFLLDQWPLQFYHALTIGWRLDSQRKISLGLTGVQDLNSGVMSRYGYAIEPRISPFDPTISMSWDSLVDNERFNLLASASISVPLTEFSRSRATVTTIGLNQSWLIKQPLPKLSVGLNGSVEYTIYSSFTDAPGNEFASGSKRQWFLSVGHFARYRFSPVFEFSTSSLFDLEKRTQTADFLQSLGRDRLKLQLNVYPGPNNLRLGLYSEGAIYGFNPAIYGFDLTVGI